MTLFKFFRNKGGQLPDGYEEVYICNALGITLTQLYEQPSWWVEKMLTWIKMRTKVEEVEAKK